LKFDSTKDEIRRGDIFTVADFGGSRGSEQNGQRPCIVVSNNVGNYYSPVVTVVPITAKLDKKDIPTHLLLEASKYDLKSNSIALVEQIRTLDRSRLLVKHSKYLMREDVDKLNHLLKVQLGLVHQ
jgi:mRNA interferase MazF